MQGAAATSSTADHQQRPRPCRGLPRAVRSTRCRPAQQPVGRSLSAFSGRATDTPATAATGDILDGVGAQAGPEAADRGTQAGRCRLRHRSADPGDALGDVDFIDRGYRSVRSQARLDHLVGQQRHRSPRPTGSPGHRVARSRRDQPENTGDSITLAFNRHRRHQRKRTVDRDHHVRRRRQAGQFLIGANSTATAANIYAALTTALGGAAPTARWSRLRA